MAITRETEEEGEGGRKRENGEKKYSRGSAATEKEQSSRFEVVIKDLQLFESLRVLGIKHLEAEFK